MRFVSSEQRKKIGEFFDRSRDTAQRNFERDGCCVPVAMFMCDQGDGILPLSPLMKDKDMASAVISKLIEKSRPLAFVLVTEAWLAMAARDAQTGDVVDDLEKKYEGHLTEPADGGKEKPKQGVKEVVMLQCCSVTGENFTLTADIVRSGGSKPVLKPWEKMENRHAEGRFMFDVTPLVERQ